MKLYSIFYIGSSWDNDAPSYEATTDNFLMWLEQHNKARILDGNEPEKEDNFDVKRIEPILFNQKERNENETIL